MKRTMTMLLGTFALAISVLAVPAVAGAAPSGLVDSSNRVIFNSQMQIVEQTPPPKSLTAGDVVLVVKAYNNTRTLTVNGQSVTINTAAIKIDFVLKNWPFASSNDKLALQVNMHSDYNHFDLGQSTGTTTVDATNDEGAGVMEHSYHETSGVEQDVRYASGPVTSSMNIGFFHFVNTATVTSTSGKTQSVPVVASYKAERDGPETSLKLYLVYPYFPSGSTLVHDPSFGLQGGLPTLYIIAGGAGVAGLAAVLVIRHRHLQVQRFPKSK